MKYSKLIALLMVVLDLGAWLTLMGVLNPSGGMNVEELTAKAEAYLAQGVYYDASQLYGQAVEADPQNYDLWLKYAQSLAQISKTTSAVEAWETAIQLDPDRPDAYENLMGFHLERNDYEAAQEVLESARKVEKTETMEQMSNTIRQNYKTAFESFSQASSWNDGYAVVSNGDSFYLSEGTEGVILKNGYSYLSAYDAETGFVSAYTEEDGWFCIDEDGYKRRVAPEGVTWMGAFGDQLVPVKNTEGLFGFLDTDMNWAQECVYQNATSFKDGIAAVCQGDKWALIDSDFDPITDFIYDQIAIDANGYCTAQGAVLAAENGQYSLLNKKGEVVAASIGEKAKPFYETGWAAVFQNGQWKYIDTKGEVKLEVAVQDADSFSNGLAAVSDTADGSSWYYIDENGNRWMDTSFEWAGPMNDTLEMMVKTAGVYRAIGLYQGPQ